MIVPSAQMPISKKVGIPLSIVSTGLITLNAFGIPINFPYGISVTTVPVIAGGVIASIEIAQQRKNLKKGAMTDARLINTLSLFPWAAGLIALINLAREVMPLARKFRHSQRQDYSGYAIFFNPHMASNRDEP